MTEAVLGPVAAVAALLVCISLGFRQLKRAVRVPVPVRVRSLR